MIALESKFFPQKKQQKIISGHIKIWFMLSEIMFLLRYILMLQNLFFRIKRILFISELLD